MARQKRPAAMPATNGHPKGSVAAVQAELDRLGGLFEGGDKMAREEPERLILFARHMLVTYRHAGQALDTMGSHLSEIGGTLAGRPPAHLSLPRMKGQATR